MKKIILAFCMLTTLTACGQISTPENTLKNGETSTETEAENISQTTYSNLSDASSQEKMKNLLKKYKVPTENIENYFYYVDYFNDAIQNDGLVVKDFAKLPENDPYAEKNYLEKLQEKSLEFMGTNCRITSFTLFKNLLVIGSEAKSGIATPISFDSAAIENFPKQIFSADEIKRYQTFFGGIPTDLVKDQAVHVKKIKKYWEENGVHFPTQLGFSIVTLWVHDDLDNIVFIGHVGLLLEDEGKYIFLEKLSFDLPYQAVIFSEKSQVKSYLLEKYGQYKTPQTADPFVMENGELMMDQQSDTVNTRNISLEIDKNTKITSITEDSSAACRGGKVVLQLKGEEKTIFDANNVGENEFLYCAPSIEEVDKSNLKIPLCYSDGGGSGECLASVFHYNITENTWTFQENEYFGANYENKEKDISQELESYMKKQGYIVK